ncbi:MAG: superoxide dismutase [Candidatus Pacebacteria bacterium]|nr:superoxide dismutase [Candidatus Paceibacterota bacterium]MBP9818353.1 superoxide dismutase [Candidatus Paceibacterota bacterium]
MTFTEKKFDIKKLVDISENSINEHLKLYAGYVRHSNLIIDKINTLASDMESNSYTIGELQRRFGFEFDGMRNHEYYFEQLEGGANEVDAGSEFAVKVAETFGSFDAWLARFKALAMTRGIGWAILYYDPETDKLLNAWIDEQHLGHLTSLKVILALDMWEHSYMLDYVPSEKKKYVEAFFANLNWNCVTERFSKAVSQKSQ